MKTAAMTLDQAVHRLEEQVVLELGGERLLCFITYAHQTGRERVWPREERFALLQVDVHEVLAGPIFNPGGIGCPSCFAQRRNENLRANERLPGDEGRSELVGSYSVDEVLVQECLALLLRQAGTSGVLDYYRLEPGGGNVRRYSFWPAQRCKSCAEAEPEDDTAVILQELERKSMFQYGSSYRAEPTAVCDTVFAPGNADSNFMIYRDRNTRSFFSLTSFFRIYREETYELGIGSSTDYRASELKSRCEALERYAGMHPRGREGLSVRSGTRSLQKRETAIDPLLFTGAVKRSGQIAAYHEELPLNWIPAFDWKRQGTVYVPECLAYYKPDDGYSAGPRIYKGNSNGNALGTTVLDGIYYACLELIERDAFLNHWYLRRSPPEILPDSVENAQIRYMTGRLTALGYTVQLFDITMETEIPVIWALCLGQTENQFAAYSTAGAHPHPEKAILSALEEMLLALEYYGTHAAEIHEKARRIRHEGVWRVEDHPILYFLQEERHHFDFLASGGQYGIRERFARFYGELQHTVIDLAEETSRLLDRMTDHYGEAFIVRQTPEGYKALGLEAVKVLVPQMQPMWFGEASRMLCGRRIRQAAQHWRMDSAEVYQAPHPFP
ncbi:TOMM precursor leader peptide-binding protein [Paenibacillus sp. FSL H8-0332]|uniref:TOMM precursor leader peptide-binding protein n=1 Tax=Paenibacillus sp. FSL H8-0332 TaxID=2954742 RepID=UPI0030CADF37